MRSGGDRPQKPVRDAVTLYAILSLLIVVVAASTGASVVRGVITAVIFFVLASGYAWVRLEQRRRKAARAPVTDDSADG